MKIGVDIVGRETFMRPPGGRDPGERALELTRRWMDIFGRRIVDRAAEILDRTTRGTGMLALGLDSDTGIEGQTVVTETTWDERYGPIAEYGPRVKSWMIEAKYAKALRFPILNESGAVEKIQYVARGHQIQFNWKESMLRPHVNPAIDELWPEIQETLAEIPNRVLD